MLTREQLEELVQQLGAASGRGTDAVVEGIVCILEGERPGTTARYVMLEARANKLDVGQQVALILDFPDGYPDLTPLLQDIVRLERRPDYRFPELDIFSQSTRRHHPRPVNVAVSPPEPPRRDAELDAAAQAKRDRREAKRAENARRTSEGQARALARYNRRVG